MAANSSVYHDVPLITQAKTWACWYTSLQMVVRYYRKVGKGAGLIDPSEDSETQNMFTTDQGIGDTATKKDERERIAKKLGFTAEYISLTADGMWALLTKGPVIYAGQWPGQSSGHWVVLTGISENTLTVNNPASGKQTWDYDQFMGKYLVQTQERPLVHAP